MKISVILEALTGAFETDMKRASKESQRAMKEMKKEAEKAGKAIGATLAASVLAAGYAIKKAVDEMDNMSKAAQKIGVTTEALSELQYAAKLADVSTSELQGGITRLIKTQAAAAESAGKQRAAFEALGVAYTNANGTLRSGDAVFKDVAQRFSEMEDGSTKTALALELFGKSGAKLIPLLNEGADGLKSAADEARKFGVVVTAEAGRAAEEFNDNLTRLGSIVQGVGIKVATDLLPDMVALSDQFVKMANDPAFISGLADAIRGIGNAVIFTADAISKSAGLFRFLGESLAAKISGPAVGDLTRIDDAISKIRDNLNLLEANPMRDTTSTFEVQLRRELALLEEKRKVTLSLAEDAARLDKSDIREVDTSTLPRKKSTVGNPFVDHTESDKAAAQAAKDAAHAQKDAAREAVRQAKELADAQKESTATVRALKLESLGEEASAVAALQDKYGDLQKAIELGTIAQQDASQVAAGLAQQWAEAANDRKKAEIDSLTSGLMTQEEMIAQSYLRRNDAILASTAITEDARKELLQRSAEDFDKQMLEQNGSFWDKWLAAAEENLNSLDELSAHTIEQFSSGFGSLFEDLIFQTGTVEEAFRNFAEGMVRNIVNALGQMAAQWLIYKAVQAASQGGAASAAAVALTAQAQAQSAMASLNAFASTAAIPIVGPALAPAAAAAAAAATQPIAAIVASLASAAAASSFAGAFDRGGNIARGQFGLVGERGPEFVSGPATVTSRVNTAAMLERAANSNAPQDIRFVNLFDAEEVANHIGPSASMERTIINVVNRNSGKIRINRGA